MGRKFANKGNSGAWSGLLIGCILSITSLFAVLTRDDGFIFRGVYIPQWIHWLMLPAGIGLTTLSIYGLMRSKPTTYTDKEVAQAEAEMDAMYLREHGELPNKPKPEPEKPKPEKSENDTK